MAFAQGTAPFVILIGPSGWGKTHLVRAAAEAALVKGSEGMVITAQAFIASPEVMCDPRPVLIDNAHDVRHKPRGRQTLRWMVEGRLKFRRPTLICLDENHSGRLFRELRTLSHDPWVARITNPEAEERELLIMQAASKMGLDLHRSIARLMARHQAGNAHTIVGALNRLSLGRGPWNQESSLPRACGLIFPLFVGSDGWDIRDVAAEAVEAAFSVGPSTLHERHTCLCWLLRRVVGLPENRVAEYLKLDARDIYHLTASIESQGIDQAIGEKAALARKAFLRMLMA
jgi:hypothetical protein